jgi:putative oxidoreductase
MIAAYFIAHLPKGGWPVENQGELALFYALVFAFFVGNGAGPFSIDEAARVRRRKTVLA